MSKTLIFAACTLVCKLMFMYKFGLQ